MTDLLDFAADLGAPPTAPLQERITAYDDLPPGPYSVGMTHWIGADGVDHASQPYTVLCGDGRAIAGHVESRKIAEKIAAALNGEMR